MPHELRLYNLDIFDGMINTLGIFEKENEINFRDFNSDNINSKHTFNKYNLNNKGFEKFLLDTIGITVDILKNQGIPSRIIHTIFIRLIFIRYLYDNNILDDSFFKKSKHPRENVYRNELVRMMRKLRFQYGG